MPMPIRALLAIFVAAAVSASEAAPVAPAAGTEVRVVGTVRVAKKGDAVVKIEILAADETYKVRLDDTALRVAAFDGRKVEASGLLEDGWLTVLEVRAAD